MPYIDANVFIYPIFYEEDQEPKVKHAKQILLSIEKIKLSSIHINTDVG